MWYDAALVALKQIKRFKLLKFSYSPPPRPSLSLLGVWRDEQQWAHAADFIEGLNPRGPGDPGATLQE